MRDTQFNFIDETFGEEVGCLLIWNDEEFIIIYIQNNEIFIKKYNDMKKFIKDFITNRSELEFLRNLIEEQEEEIRKLEGDLKNERRKKDIEF